MTLKRRNEDGTYDTVCGQLIVADNLTTDSGTQALSAKQGTLIKSSIDSINATLNAMMQKVYDGIYPKNTIVIGFSKPNVPSGVTATWTEQSTYNGRYLKLDSNQNVGKTLNEELPNIKGTAEQMVFDGGFGGTGAMHVTGYTGLGSKGSGYTAGGKIEFDASWSESIYKDGGRVQPFTVTIKMWKRTA